uniref:Tumor necrosis factor receptor superfamily member 5 n=1 Tax=Naja naja TaxID=35670 RepID=A0A8C6XYJ9_NAJNA
MGRREPRRLPAPIKGSGWRWGAEAAPMEWRRWSTGLSAAVLLMLQGLAFAQGLSCNRTEYQLNGRCCSRCPPGQKVATACSGQLNTSCIPCEEDHFQASWTKEFHCTQHRTCKQKAGLTVYQNGTKEQDFICRCREGTHCSSPECETCKPHTSCGAGEGAQREGSHLHDTLCAPCSLGFFSNVSSTTARCQPWSRCQEGQLQKAKGTQATDVTCETPPLKHHNDRKNYLLVLLPIAAFLLGGLLFLWRRHGRCPWKRHPDPSPEPTENEEECPTFPTQETLLGQQAGLQEKDCRLAQQEQV